jgi:hypothetical protein
MKTSLRDTGTGDVLEKMVLPSLERGGYTCSKRTSIGKRPAGGKHIVDAIATKNNENILISLKWQQVSGTAEQKIPYEVICLLKAVKDSHDRYVRSYIVLGGEGWSLRKFFVDGGLNEYLIEAEKVKIVTFENFIYLANKGML